MSVKRGRGKRACGSAFRGSPRSPLRAPRTRRPFPFCRSGLVRRRRQKPGQEARPRKEASEMQGLRYTSRGLRRRNNTDKREVTLPHVDPVTGETARTSRTVGAKTKKGAEKAHDALIFGLGSDGGAVGSSMTVREFMEQFPRYKEASGTIKPSTARSYRGELPGARERLDDARHLRRRGPTRSYSYLLFPQGKSSAPPQPARSPRAMTEPLSTLPCGGHSTGRDRFYWCHASRGPPCRRAI